VRPPSTGPVKRKYTVQGTEYYCGLGRDAWSNAYLGEDDHTMSTARNETTPGTGQTLGELDHRHHGEAGRHDRAGHGHASHGHHGHGDHSDGNGHRTHRFNAEHAERLLADERAQSFPPEGALRTAGVGPGMTVLDLGCGPGFFTIPAHQIVGPSGHVIAADVQPEMLDHLRGRLSTAGITDIEVVHSGEGHAPVADHLADVVLAAFVLHEANDPASFIAECARIVKPHGAVAIIEWRHDADLDIRADHRIAVPAITELAISAGLEGHAVTILDDERVLVRFTRTAS